MKIDPSNLDRSQFKIKEINLFNEECLLIIPSELGVDWTQDNLVFRSVLLRKSDNHPVSLNWKKFLNLNEKPHLYPDPKNYNDWTIDSKEDGSTCLISKYKGNLITRTRGSPNLDGHANAHEVKDILDKNPNITDNYYVNSEKYTLLFEWLSPSWRIIIKHEKPELILIGGIKHEDYSCLSVKELDQLAAEIGVKRPKKFTFNNISEIIENCKTLENQEGYVLSYNNNQNRVKLKGDWYLKIHYLKAQVGGIKGVTDLWFAWDKPGQDQFFELVSKNLDFEIANLALFNIQKVVGLGAWAQKTLDEIREFIYALNGGVIDARDRERRKISASKIIQKYKDTGFEGVAFKFLYGFEIEEKDFRKMMEILDT